MYVTRALSVVQKSGENLAAAPEGPNSGFLVIQDSESETYSMFGLKKNRTVKKLPFPQDKEVAVRYPRSWGVSANVSLPIPIDGIDMSLDAATPSDSSHSVFFIPALNHSLSSNRYYALLSHGKHKGEALTSSKEEEDDAPCCFSSGIVDEKPRPLDPNDEYQQFAIFPGRDNDSFSAKSAAADGVPPKFLRKKGWTATTKTPSSFKLGAAQGVDSQLRASPLELDSPGARAVGKWYAPFVFVKEGDSVREQVERSMYYEVTMEQRWERIFKTDNRDRDKGINSVVIHATVATEEVFVGGSRAAWDEGSAADKVVWFKVEGDGGGGVGLRVELVERMKWEEERGGWVGGEERQVKIHREEELEGGGDWNEFGCYVLVETFNLRRIDGSLVMSYHFRHFNQLKNKWE